MQRFLRSKNAVKDSNVQGEKEYHFHFSFGDSNLVNTAEDGEWPVFVLGG